MLVRLALVMMVSIEAQIRVLANGVIDSIVTTARKALIRSEGWLEASIAVHTCCGDAFDEPLRSAIVRALSFNFEPDPVDMKRRARWLHASQVKAISQSGVLDNLGLDLHRIIADFCFDSYALVNLQFCVPKWAHRNGDNPRVESVSIMQPIWATLHNFEGINCGFSY